MSLRSQWNPVSKTKLDDTWGTALRIGLWHPYPPTHPSIHNLLCATFKEHLRLGIPSVPYFPLKHLYQLALLGLFLLLESVCWLGVGTSQVKYVPNWVCNKYQTPTCTTKRCLQYQSCKRAAWRLGSWDSVGEAPFLTWLCLWKIHSTGFLEELDTEHLAQY